jgi:hypothetical protein
LKMFELKIILSLDSSLMALLSAAANASAGNFSPPPPPPPSTSTATTGTASVLGTAAQAAPAAPASADGGENAGKRDAAGTLFDPTRHTGTIVKSGLWRMKTGLSRGPGEGEDAIPAAGNPPPPPPPGAATVPAAEEDEFAQFASQAAAPSAPAARNWTDADLSALCNQAAQKDGNPERVKPLIAKYIPAGQVAHSRNIPAEQRENFAREVEQTIGIQFGG